MNAPEAVLAFCLKFEERMGVKYLPHFARDGKLMKSVLAVHHDSFDALLERFFSDEDEWLREAGYTIPIFYNRINKYASTSVGRSAYGELRGALQGSNVKASPQHGGEASNAGSKGGVPTPIRADVREAETVSRGSVSPREGLRLTPAFSDEDAS